MDAQDACDAQRTLDLMYAPRGINRRGAPIRGVDGKEWTGATVGAAP